jgi:hypothetical protein
MKLLTKEIENKFKRTPLYSQDGKGLNANILCKFFMTCSDFTYYVLEAEKQADNDWLLFGICTLNGSTEYGYQLLSELQSVRNRFGLGVERDLYFNGCKVADIEKSELQRLHLSE